MTATLSANYVSTTNAAGTFNVESAGWVQGMFVDDPAIRYQLAGGVLASTESLPMWGGVGINETVTPVGTYTPPSSLPPVSALGGYITRATNVTAGAAGQLTGFSVFNQAYGMVITTASPVPLAGSGMQVNFFRLGSGARIVVACAASLVSLEAGSITAAVSWDFVNQQLVPYVPAYATATSTAVAYNSTTGVLSLTFAAAPLGASSGDLYDGTYISVSGITGTGAGVASLAGDFPLVTTTTSGTVLQLQAPTGLVASGLGATSAVIAAGGGALPVKVLQIDSGKSMTVNYSATTKAATWNYSGTVAVILI
jgi:hypothetical protein